MLGQLVQRLQALSPVTSPVASPINSPKSGRRRRPDANKAYRQIQSEPEDSAPELKPRAKRNIDKMRRRVPLQPSKSMGRIDGIKQVQRLSQYEQYFEALLNEEQRHDEELIKARAKVKQSLKRGQEESDLERIQDLFPNDCLRLYDRDACLTMRMKGLMRKRSGAAARLQRALSAKSVRTADSPPPNNNTNNNNNNNNNNINTISGNMVHHQQHQIVQQQQPAQPKRQFIMESPVQFTAGVTSQERHLFLFNDLLLIAKARSGGNFKLKEKVRVSEIWLTKSSIDIVAEIHKCQHTSFLIGWPTTNVVATFGTQAARDLWWNKLTEMVNAEKSKEPCTTNIQVTYFDHATNIEYCKTFAVGPDDTARGCIKHALEQLEMRGCDPSEYQLWAKTSRDEALYPLVGHERPFAIKLSSIRDTLASEETFSIDHCNNIHDPSARCHFVLRNASKVVENEKKPIKKTTSRIRIGQVFRRSVSKDNTVCLFGLPLSRICEGDALPRPVMAMLQQVFTKGPFTQGIFRKSANARLVRELREKLDSGEAVSLDHVPVLVTAALLKEFLRSLPDPLLSSALYPQWRAALDTPNVHQRIIRLKRVVDQLAAPNRALLGYFLCVLQRVSRRAGHNLMSATNLGVCVGPSLLWMQHDPNSQQAHDHLRAVPLLVENLITHCELIIGPHLNQLMGDPRDSGTEESDSLRRDDSSIDSLECSPPPRKDKISLSRDSGLTMSDSQLYTPDEEESGSTSSSGYDPAFDPHTKVTPSLSVPPEYVRVYGGWEERLNPNFQRQAWFRQRSRRLNGSTALVAATTAATATISKKEAVRRSASEESLLDSSSNMVVGGVANGSQPQLMTSASIANLKPLSAGFEELFKRHPPLKKVTAVHCEVISEPRRHQYRQAQPLPPPPAYSTMKKQLQQVAESPKKDGYTSQSLCNIERSLPEIYYTPKPQMFSPRTVDTYTSRLDTSASSEGSLYKTCISEMTPPLPPPPTQTGGDMQESPYYSNNARRTVGPEECDDSSTLSDDDWTPHVSRSNSRGNEVSRGGQQPLRISHQEEGDTQLRHYEQRMATQPSSYSRLQESPEIVPPPRRDNQSYPRLHDPPEVAPSALRLAAEPASLYSRQQDGAEVRRGVCEVPPRLRHLPPVHADMPAVPTSRVRPGRLKQRHMPSATQPPHRSRSLPPPLPPHSSRSRRAPITSYYLGGDSPEQPPRYQVVPAPFRDEESYV